MNNHGKANCAGLVVAFFAALFVLAVSLGLGPPACRQKSISYGISNCRRITAWLNVYAADHNGRYPGTLTDPQSSNEAFRALFQASVTDDESIFGCPNSPFRPDGKIGNPPDFPQALEPGENHWAMTGGMDDNLPANVPLVYENPVSGTAWPPRWNASAKDTPTRGRAWPPGIIVGQICGAVVLEKLESDTGTSVGLHKGEDGKDLFERGRDAIKEHVESAVDLRKDIFQRIIDPPEFPAVRVLDALDKK